MIPSAGNTVISGVQGNVSVHSTRNGAVARFLTGKTPEEASVLIRLLFGLCPNAQTLCFRSAAALARGEAIRNAAPASLALEILGEHLRFLASDLPKALGITVNEDLKFLSELRASAMKDELSGKELSETLAKARKFAERVFLAGLPFPKSLCGEAAGGDLPYSALAARIIRTVAFDYPMTLGQSEAMRLEVNAQTLPEIIQETEGDRFSAEPSLSGTRRFTAAESVPYFPGRSPSLLETALGRFMEVEKITSGTFVPEAKGISPAPGSGLSWVPTARGLLIHAVKLDENGKIAHLSITAPTEWNFAPGGAVELAVNALREPSIGCFRKLAELISLQYDACVPCLIDLKETL